jgi:hypothetical protein
MNFTALVTDITRAVADAAPLPDFTDRAAVKAFAVKLIPDLIDLGFDAGGLQASYEALALAELESIVKAALPVEKLGDGTILKWIVANLPTIISIISLFVKVPATP